MPIFRVHRMKESPRQQFRWAPHTSGATALKPKDYEPDGELEASGFYSAWAALKADDRPMEVGDALENEAGELRICKYVGLEQARWVVPEPKPASDQEIQPTRAVAAAGA